MLRFCGSVCIDLFGFLFYWIKPLRQCSVLRLQLAIQISNPTVIFYMNVLTFDHESKQWIILH